MKRSRGRTRPFVKFVFFILFTILVLGCAYWFVCLSKPGRSKGLLDKADTSLRVATININAFRFLKTPEEAAGYLLSVAENNEIDVLFLQEYFQSKWFSDKAFRKMLFPEYPYVYTEGEQAIISRHPVLEFEFNIFPSSDNSYITTLVDVDGEPVRMISAHLQTTGFNAIDDDAKTSVALGYVLKANDEVRLSQARQLRAEIDASEYPVIVVGDFNSIPYSKVYRYVKQKTLKDTYLEKGHGKGSTYRMLRDILRIDYILHDNNFECVDYMICDDYISDHRMVISTLKKI